MSIARVQFGARFVIADSAAAETDTCCAIFSVGSAGRVVDPCEILTLQLVGMRRKRIARVRLIELLLLHVLRTTRFACVSLGHEHGCARYVVAAGHVLTLLMSELMRVLLSRVVLLVLHDQVIATLSLLLLATRVVCTITHALLVVAGGLERCRFALLLLAVLLLAPNRRVLLGLLLSLRLA